MNKFLLILIATVSLSACNDNSSDAEMATITGSDGRKCTCCGGYFIKIKTSIYRFDANEIGESNINFNAADLDFPIAVRVKWSPKEDQCLGDEIVVSRLYKR